MPKVRQDIELLRIFSTFLIVWYHSGVAWGHTFAFSGLVAFIVISMYFAGIHEVTVSPQVLRRAGRLLAPWSIWFVIYGVKNLAANQPLIPYAHTNYFGLLSGSSVHLWYLPYIFLCLVLFDFSQFIFSGFTIAVISPILAGSLLATSPIWEPVSVQIGYPVAQYAHALSAVFLGIFFSQHTYLPKSISYIFIAILTAITLFRISSESIGIPYLAGLGVGCILIFAPFEKIKFPDFSGVSKLTFGIYLSHILALYLMNKLYPNSGFWLPIFAFIFSAVLIFYIQKYFPKISRFVTGS